MKIIGIDYGRKKIGLAMADTETKMISPLPVTSFSGFEPQFVKIAAENGIKKAVIGLTGGKIDEEIKRFGQRLGEEQGLSIEYVDETLTTQEAQRLLRESGAKRKTRKNKEDAIAAALMLQYYLEGGSKNV